MALLGKLQETVAGFLEIAPSQLTASARLNGKLNHSIGRAALDAAIRRDLRVNCRAVYSAVTYGELETAISQSLGMSPADVSTVAAAANSHVQPVEMISLAPSSGKCGIDLELIENLPSADDYWEAEFYKQNFTPDEIAYCSRRDDPRQHFAARWCVKEALKKCDASFLAQPMSSLEISHAPDGQPQLFLIQGQKRDLLPHSLSFSHTTLAAVAMVYLVHDHETTAMRASIESEPMEAKPAQDSPRLRVMDVILAAIATLSLAVALWAALHF